jgi:hypothetical protein
VNGQNFLVPKDFLKEMAGPIRYPGMKPISHPADGFSRSGLDDGSASETVSLPGDTCLPRTVAQEWAGLRRPTLIFAAEGAGWASFFPDRATSRSVSRQGWGVGTPARLKRAPMRDVHTTREERT